MLQDEAVSKLNDFIENSDKEKSFDTTQTLDSSEYSDNLICAKMSKS